MFEAATRPHPAAILSRPLVERIRTAASHFLSLVRRELSLPAERTATRATFLTDGHTRNGEAH